MHSRHEWCDDQQTGALWSVQQCQQVFFSAISLHGDDKRFAATQWISRICKGFDNQDFVVSGNSQTLDQQFPLQIIGDMQPLQIGGRPERTSHCGFQPVIK